MADALAGAVLVHEGGIIKTGTCSDSASDALKEFLTRFWAYYDQLLVYRQHPTTVDAVRLEAEFDALFGTPSGYAELDKRMATTLAHKDSLLLVLKFPELPLHNNPAELGARGRVRKRDVSFGPRTENGRQAWDTFMTLAATLKN